MDERESINRNTSPILVVTGPTAVGKTQVSVEVAQRLGAEIVSCDSRQVFRGLDAGTAKPSSGERDVVPHHFIDEHALDDAWSAGRFAAAAEARIQAIMSRGRVPLVVGGSTLYLEALVYGLPDVPPPNPEVRARLTTEATRPGGLRALYERLAELDPVGAASLDPTRRQQVIRALEVTESSGCAWSSYSRNDPRYRYRVAVLTRDRGSLYRRVNKRVEEMLRCGLLDEVRSLLVAGYDFEAPPLRTIGYSEPAAYLQGLISRDEMVRLLKRNTRRYAKRQLTWFRRWNDSQWFDVEGAQPDELVSLLEGYCFAG